jgi:hypothetical protein
LLANQSLAALKLGTYSLVKKWPQIFYHSTKVGSKYVVLEKLESRVGSIQWHEIVPLRVSKSRQVKLTPTSAPG